MNGPEILSVMTRKHVLTSLAFALFLTCILFYSSWIHNNFDNVNQTHKKLTSMESHKYQETFNSSKIVANRGVYPLVKRKIKINITFVYSVHVNKLPNRRLNKTVTKIVDELPSILRLERRTTEDSSMEWKIAALDFCKSHFTKKKKKKKE